MRGVKDIKVSTDAKAGFQDPFLFESPSAFDAISTRMPVCLDQLQRPLKSLRLSVIDQCNFRCTYCMPKEIYTKDYPFLKAGSRLSFQQMVSIAKGFVSLGVEKVRLTGGEPLLRKDIEKLVEALARLTTPDGRPVEIVLTTNGTLLAAKARALKDAGLAGVTVSLDSLDDAVFRHMNDVGFPVGKVLDGIEAARNAGIDTVKVNTVIEKGVNDSQILPLAKYFRHSGVTPRFIEFMDVGGAESWSMQRVLRSEDVRNRIAQAYPLVPRPGFRGSDTAQRFLYADGGGEVGFISSVSKPFCGDCTRARVSADGRMFLCLFAERGVDLRQWLTESTSPEALRDAIRSRWERRDDRYSELRTERLARNGKKSYPTVRMSLVGG